MSAILVLSFLFGLFVLPLCCGFLQGWWFDRREGLERPWNWRVLVWPGLYFSWLDREQKR